MEPSINVFSANSVDITFTELALSASMIRPIPLRVLFSNIDSLMVILDCDSLNMIGLPILKVLS